MVAPVSKGIQSAQCFVYNHRTTCRIILSHASFFARHTRGCTNGRLHLLATVLC